MLNPLNHFHQSWFVFSQLIKICIILSVCSQKLLLFLDLMVKLFSHVMILWIIRNWNDWICVSLAVLKGIL